MTRVTDVSEALRVAEDEDAIDCDALAVRDAAQVLARIVRQFREIHSPRTDSGRYLECKGCGLDGQENAYEWPCEQAKLLGFPKAEMAVRWDR